uniref:Uncharacterized protein n=1 Tax=Anguilla anguilla TaxID=7936 RepID=A0A0E9PKV8_ANGAN
MFDTTTRGQPHQGMLNLKIMTIFCATMQTWHLSTQGQHFL